jgi:hypothetical protein
MRSKNKDNKPPYNNGNFYEGTYTEPVENIFKVPDPVEIKFGQIDENGNYV